jgi:hypothetical protein
MFSQNTHRFYCSLLSTRLGWSISSKDLISVPSILRQRRSSPVSSQPVLAPLDAYARDTGPAMNIPPIGYPDMVIDGGIYHATRRFELAGLVLPTDWEVMLWLLATCPTNTDQLSSLFNGNSSITLEGVPQSQAWDQIWPP